MIKNLNYKMETKLPEQNVMEYAYLESCKIGGDRMKSATPFYGGDLQKLSSKLPSFPWSKYKGEHHLPQHDFTGPGTRLDLRLDKFDKPLPNSKPKNRIDAAAYKHDLAYRSEKLEDRHKADKIMIEELKAIKNPTFREKVERAIIIKMLQAKLKLGQGQMMKSSATPKGGGLTKEQRNSMSKEELEKWADEIHKPFNKSKYLLKVKVFHKDDIWSADLIELPSEYRGRTHYKFVLTVIDLYTKFAWVRKLKNKTGIEVKNAFEDIMKISKRKPKKLWVDQGSEFYNKNFKAMLKENEMEMYSTFNEGKAVVIENFNRILKTKLFKQFTINGNQKWINIIQDVVDKYNEKTHSLIQVSPKEASQNPEKIKKIIMQNNYENELNSFDVKFKKKKKSFKVGDRVRIFKYKFHFEKGFTGFWTNEIFKIDKINNTDPITYNLVDLEDEEIYGKFYTHELQKTDF